MDSAKQADHLSCLCGHVKKSHFRLDFESYGKRQFDDVCGECVNFDDWIHKFKLDNLLYLEKLYESKQR